MTTRKGGIAILLSAGIVMTASNITGLAANGHPGSVLIKNEAQMSELTLPEESESSILETAAESAFATLPVFQPEEVRYLTMKSSFSAESGKTSDNSAEEDENVDAETEGTDEISDIYWESEEALLDYAGNHLLVDDTLIDGSLNIREYPDKESEVVGKFYPGAAGTILSEEEGWYEVESGEVTGWVSSDYVITGQEAAEKILNEGYISGIVNSEALNVRKEMTSEEDNILEVAAENTILTVLSFEEDGWIGVLLENDSRGYVRSEYLTMEGNLISAMTLEEEEAYLAELAAEAARIAEEKAAEEARIAAAEQAAQAAAAQAAAQAAAAQAAASQSTAAATGSGVALSESDIRMIACIVHAEAGSEIYAGKLAVANVVLNRYKLGWWGSIHDVIYAQGQFDTAGIDRLNYYMSVEPPAECWQAARDAVAGNNNVGGYIFFCSSRSARPENYSSYVWIGTQCFYAR